MKAVSATDLAKNTRQILDMVVEQGETVLVERNHTTIARITPPERRMTAAEALAGLCSTLTGQQADAWQKDSKGDFDESVTDPWA